MKIKHAVAVLAAVTTLFLISPAAHAGSPDTPKQHGHIHAIGAPGQAHKPGKAGTVLGFTYGQPPLLYHSGGAIAKSVTFYAIWWNPGKLQDGTTSNLGVQYKSLIPQFLRDYSGNGLARNNTQYYGNYGVTPNVHITATTHFGGAFLVTTPYPTNQCTTSETGANCVTNANIGAIAAATAKAHSINAGTNKMFLVFTPAREGSCFSAGACPDVNASYTGFCAFHSYGTATFGPYPQLVYTNEPWPISPSGQRNCYAPWLGQSAPSGNVNADAAINLVSHEVTEAITDPLLNAWFDVTGYEIGDECAWEFGPNVTWNTHPYSIQPEASNAANGCVYDGP